MKLLKLWEKIGKQPLKISQHTDVIVNVHTNNGQNIKCFVTGINYESGKFIGLEAVQISCSSCQNNVEYPPPHTCDICNSLNQDEFCMWECKR